MAGSWRIGVGILVAVTLDPGAANAFGGRQGIGGSPAAAMPAYSYVPSYSYSYAPYVPSYSVVPHCYAVPMLTYAYPATVRPAYPQVVPLAPAQAQTPLAVPRPAPPSQTVEPPASEKKAETPARPISTPAPEKKAPQVVESRSMGGAGAAEPAKDRCRVGFWNATGKEVTLTVDGKAHTLPRDRAVTLELDRQFVWQADQGPAQAVQVPGERSAHEIVLRP